MRGAHHSPRRSERLVRCQRCWPPLPPPELQRPHVAAQKPPPVIQPWLQAPHPFWSAQLWPPGGVTSVQLLPPLLVLLAEAEATA